MVRSRSTSVNALSPAEVQAEGVDALFLVWLVSRSTEDLLNTALAPSGLTGDEYAIYSVLSAAPTMTPTELARWMAAPATTVSSYVKRFEGRGHVTREPNPDDRRSYRIRLTPSGRRTHRTASALFIPVRNEVAEALGGGAEDALAVLLRLRTVVDGIRAGEGAGTKPQAGLVQTET